MFEHPEVSGDTFHHHQKKREKIAIKDLFLCQSLLFKFMIKGWCYLGMLLFFFFSFVMSNLGKRLLLLLFFYISYCSIVCSYAIYILSASSFKIKGIVEGSFRGRASSKKLGQCL